MYELYGWIENIFMKHIFVTFPGAKLRKYFFVKNIF